MHKVPQALLVTGRKGALCATQLSWVQSHSLLAHLEEDGYRKVKTEQWETILVALSSLFSKVSLVLACTSLQMLLWYTPPSLPLHCILPVKTEDSSESKT